MKIYTVSEVTSSIRQLLEEHFAELWIEGEVTNFRPASSGHYYFSLKDDACQIRAVMFRGANQRLKFRLENGLAALCYGHINVYEPRGEYQIIVEHIEPKGVGALQLAFEQLKEKLESEGLFRAERKRPLPFLPRKIGIITSATGSVIRDMIHVLTRRFPPVQILLHPVAVQGEGAGAEIATAIAQMNAREDIDLLIVGRGGGSMEDLWAFNEEVVVRAMAASRLPVISAVGHETDFTIADFVADVRAPTPSAAAELAVPVYEDLLHTVDEWRYRLHQAVRQTVDHARLRLRQWEGYFRDPGRRLTETLLRLDYLEEQALFHLKHRLEVRHHEVGSLSARLESLNPRAILARGYAIVSRLDDGRIVKKSQDVVAGDSVAIRLGEGSLKARVQDKIPPKSPIDDPGTSS